MQFVQIPLINEHIFCKYFVCLSVGNATKGFATYGCFHPCFLECLSQDKHGTGSVKQFKTMIFAFLHTIFSGIFFAYFILISGYSDISPPPPLPKVFIQRLCLSVFLSMNCVFFL